MDREAFTCGLKGRKKLLKNIVVSPRFDSRILSISAAEAELSAAAANYIKCTRIAMYTRIYLYTHTISLIRVLYYYGENTVIKIAVQHGVYDV